jgi:hypothetical protein
MKEFVLTGYIAPKKDGIQRIIPGDWRFQITELLYQRTSQNLESCSLTTSVQIKYNIYPRAIILLTWLRTELGFPDLTNPYALGEPHLIALAKHILQKRKLNEIGAASAHNLADLARNIAVWIEKPELVPVFDEVIGKKKKKHSILPLVLSPRQIKIRSDWLGEKSDKTSYWVDRLHREARLTREEAMGLDREQAVAITKGRPYLRRCKDAKLLYITLATHGMLFREVVQFMDEQNRNFLCWVGMDSKNALYRHAVTMSRAGRFLFPKGRPENVSHKGVQS